MAHLLAALRGAQRGTGTAIQATLPAWLLGGGAGGEAAAAASAAAAAPGAAAAATPAGQWHGEGLFSQQQQQQQQSRGYAHHAHKSDAYRTPPTNYVQLLQHISNAKHVNQLDALLKDYGDKFDALHVSAAITALPRLLGRRALARGAGMTPEQRKRPAEILERLQAMAALHAGRLQVRQISNIVWALGRCRKLDASPDSDAASSSNGGGGGGPRAAAGALLSELARGRFRKLHQGANSKDLAQLSHGMARLGLRSPSALAAISNALKAVAAPGRPVAISDLAIATWALGKLDHRDEDLLRIVGDRAVEERLYLRPWSAAALMRTYAAQHVKHDALAAAVAEVALDQAGTCRPEHLAQLAWALSRQRLAPATADALRRALGGAALKQLEGFGSVELGLLLEGLEALGGADSALLDAVARGIAKETEVVAAPGDVARILRPFAAARGRASNTGGGGGEDGSQGPADEAAVGEMADRLSAAAARCVPAFTPPQAEAVAACLAKLPRGGGASGGGPAAGGGDAADAEQAAPSRHVQYLFRRLGHHAAARPELYSLRRLEKLLASFQTADVIHERLAEATGTRLAEACDVIRQGGGGGGGVVRDEEKEAAAAAASVTGGLDAAIDLAARLASARRLAVQPAGALAAAAAPRLRELRPRPLAALLVAACSRGELLTSEPVRALVVAAADELDARLSASGTGGALGSAAHAAALAAALGRAIQNGLLAGRGAPLVSRLLDAVSAASSEEGGGGGGASGGLPPRAARDVVAAIESAGVEGPPGLRAAAERALAAAAGGGGGDLMEAWEPRR